MSFGKLRWHACLAFMSSLGLSSCLLGGSCKGSTEEK